MREISISLKQSKKAEIGNLSRERRASEGETNEQQQEKNKKLIAV